MEVISVSEALTSWNSCSKCGVFGNNKNFNMLLNKYDNGFTVDNDDYINSLIVLEYIGDLLTNSYIARHELDESWGHNALMLIEQPFYHLVFNNLSSHDTLNNNFGCNSDIINLTVKDYSNYGLM